MHNQVRAHGVTVNTEGTTSRMTQPDEQWTEDEPEEDDFDEEYEENEEDDLEE